MVELKSQMKGKKISVLYVVLRLLVIMTLIASIFTRNYENVFTCVLVLVLFLLPIWLERRLRVKMPDMLIGIVLLMVFFGEFLGEVFRFYAFVPGWDSMCHTLSGFMFAAVGFSLAELLNSNSKSLKLSPFYLSLMAFCFSMTIGVLWEFFEYGVDTLLLKDMQKDFVVQQFASISLDPAAQGNLVSVKDITDTYIYTASGEVFHVEGGYLDIGINDTMKDLLVTFIGAVVFSVSGYILVKRQPEKSIAKDLIIHRADEADEARQ